MLVRALALGIGAGVPVPSFCLLYMVKARAQLEDAQCLQYFTVIMSPEDETSQATKCFIKPGLL